MHIAIAISLCNCEKVNIFSRVNIFTHVVCRHFHFVDTFNFDSVSSLYIYMYILIYYLNHAQQVRMGDKA